MKINLSLLVSFALFFICHSAYSNPQWDKSKIPLDSSLGKKNFARLVSQIKKHKPRSQNTEALRITVEWNEKSETYKISHKVIEQSGTPALTLRAPQNSPFGSFKASATETSAPNAEYFDSIGTGQAYRRLSRFLTFRFPVPRGNFIFKMTVENPIKGQQELVIEETILKEDLKIIQPARENFEFFELKKATLMPSLEVVIYAEGFVAENKSHFLESAMRTIDILQSSQFPGFENMNFVGVFTTSNEKLGDAADLGYPVVRRNSAFGLYYPYWHPFGRWYHVIYPTDENYFRSQLAVVPYDYNIILVDSSDYWGVGNYRSHTAIPTKSDSFKYLLLHELGHYFGLNEEYDGGGPTELEFAPEIQEAWSQNMTFLPQKNIEGLKWINFISDLLTPIPTPKNAWTPGKMGAYSGGYGDSVNAHSESYKPGLNCLMSSGAHFCSVCNSGIQTVINFDLGKRVSE